MAEKVEKFVQNLKQILQEIKGRGRILPAKKTKEKKRDNLLMSKDVIIKSVVKF